MPERHLLAQAVHPGHRPALVLVAGAQVEARAAQEVLALAHTVVVPDGELEAALHDLLDGEVLPGDGLLPAGGGGAPTDPRLLLRPGRLDGQEVAGEEGRGGSAGPGGMNQGRLNGNVFQNYRNEFIV